MQFIIMQPSQILKLIFLFLGLNTHLVFSQQIKNINAINNQRNIDFNCIIQDKMD
jgi:hypothetical protein